VSYPVWITPAGDLGIIRESQFYELILDAYIENNGFGASAIIDTISNYPPYTKENIGVITSVRMLKNGGSYTTDFVDLYADGGTGFVGQGVVVGGTIVSVNILNGGYGYSTEQTTLIFDNGLDFFHLSGTLPPGLYVTPRGSLRGVPTVTNPDQKTFEFAIRARNRTTGTVSDRTFTMTIGDIQPPVFVQNQTFIGNYFDGTYFNFQLHALEVNPAAILTYSISNGELPAGLTLTSDGLIYGYITPLLDQGISNNLNYSVAPYDEVGYDTLGKYRNEQYTFTVRVDDGAGSAIHQYSMKVFAKGNWSTDSGIDTVDNSIINIYDLTGTEVSADASNVYIPVVTTPPQSLPTIRSGSDYAFKFDAYDPEAQVLNFEISSYTTSGFDQDGTDIYDINTVSDILNFTSSLSSDLSTVTIQGKSYNTTNGVANIVIDTASYKPGNVTVNSVYYVNNKLLTYLVLDKNVTVYKGNVLTQPTTGANANVYLSSTGSVITLVDSVGSFASNVGNVFVAGLGNTYIFRDGANLTAATTQANSTYITYPTAISYTPVSNITVWANTIIMSGRLSANITVTQPANPALTGTAFDTIRFDQTGSSFPNNLVLDQYTGWLSGHILPQVEVSKTYTFEVSAYRENDATIISNPVEYTLTVLGDINNSVTWLTDTDLGKIDNGATSQLMIQATATIAGVPTAVTYSYVTAGSSLPNGLKLLSNGLIVGRASFEYFSLDTGATSIDGNKTTFDDTYSFTVKVTSVDGRVSDTKTFTLSVNNYNRIPYENLYLKALTSLDQRKLFLSIVNNTDIFPETLIYRAKDPYFGRARDIRSLFLSGLTPSALSQYAEAISTNHFTKRITFGDIKTARALDTNFNVKYEVVYLDLLDPVMDQGRSPADSMLLTNIINQWYAPDGATGGNVYYPNAFNNMRSVTSNNIGFSHAGSLPEWMTSTQEDGKVLGFRPAVVLAYTVAGASKLMAYRLQTAGLEFNQIDFVVDRYDLDNGLSKNFNTSISKFYGGRETTFDRILRLSNPDYSVDFALRGLTFDSIHNKTVEQVRSLGGFDGTTAFFNNDLIVFAQQEQYDGYTGSNDGWNLITATSSTPIPGYLDRIVNTFETSLLTDAVAGTDYIAVASTAGIQLGYTVEIGASIAPAVTVKKIVGNTIYLENRYNKSSPRFILNAIAAGSTVSFAPIDMRSAIWQVKIVDSPVAAAFVPIYASDFGSDSIGFDTRTWDPLLGWLNAPPTPTQIVQLSLYSPVRLQEKIQINQGVSLGSTIIYYDPILKPGLSVPEYTRLSGSTSGTDATIFDTTKTKFINNRDSYLAPEEQDKYIKFPKIGVFK
jgi:hypothetical protein